MTKCRMIGLMRHVCLYKGKGSRLDPKMYRGISLIEAALIELLNSNKVDFVQINQHEMWCLVCGETWRESGDQKKDSS